ncbi:hypothetical protein [Natrinema halophilum]|uniref:Uncharacterized protein n=1 Tax=Natrinema halophilum TaxID=1699371 RepID=A0A7D5KC94_9EURY|nr:hypothetical protein [Natrinema halophilum]QLG48396.1 cbb3-type cytochrome c oxidase subunit I [Natrinema halophilum]
MKLHTRTNPFLLMAGLYMVLGVLAATGKLTFELGLVEALPRLRWVTIHFVTIGGMTQTVFGVLPRFVAAVTDGSRSIHYRNRWLQWGALNAGYPLILIGMTAGSATTAGTGAGMVLVALVSLFVTLYRLRPASNRSGGVGRYFRTAPSFLVIGILAAFGMLFGIHGPGGYFGSLEAHVHANVWGFLGLVVAGVLLTVLPRLLDVPLRFPRLRVITYWGLTVGAMGLVAGPWLARHEFTIGGLAMYVLGTTALLVNVGGTYRLSERTWDSRFVLVLGAYLWLLFPVPWAPLVILFPDAVPAGAIETAAINGLVFGWMLQLAMAFLPVVAIAALQPSSEFIGAIPDATEEGSSPSWLQVGSVNTGMLFLWATAFPPVVDVASLLTLAGYFLITAAWAVFVVDLWGALVGRNVVPRHADESPSG